MLCWYNEFTISKAIASPPPSPGGETWINLSTRHNFRTWHLPDYRHASAIVHTYRSSRARVKWALLFALNNKRPYSRKFPYHLLYVACQLCKPFGKADLKTSERVCSRLWECLIERATWSTHAPATGWSTLLNFLSLEKCMLPHDQARRKWYPNAEAPFVEFPMLLGSSGVRCPAAEEATLVIQSHDNF